MKFPIGIALALLLSVNIAFAVEKSQLSYDNYVKSSLPEDILWKVIARNGTSKRYDQLFGLDGGTVGIPNFAVGGLAILYDHMDTEKYFGRSRQDMVQNYSGNCRPKGHKGQDTGWGCYSKSWWREGMRRFVNSSESKQVQISAWNALMKPTIQAALDHGWSTDRSLAIAAGIANSMGSGGFKSLAAKHHWMPEQTLSAYVAADASGHRRRRSQAIAAAFPMNR